MNDFSDRLAIREQHRATVVAALERAVDAAAEPEQRPRLKAV